VLDRDDALNERWLGWYMRLDGRVVSLAVVIAIGVRVMGEREVLGLDRGPSEDGAFWLAFLRALVARGLDDDESHPSSLTHWYEKVLFRRRARPSLG
jgi:Transposase, Mutator family